MMMSIRSVASMARPFRRWFIPSSSSNPYCHVRSLSTDTATTNNNNPRSNGTTPTSTTDQKSRIIPLYWLDLRASGLSMLERLSLEEALLRHDDRNWVVVGTHEAGWNHKYLSSNNNKTDLPHYISSPSSMHPDCLIVMGIGGKPEKLLNVDKVKQDQVLVCKRFSGGGTVVLDANSMWTTLIGRTKDFQHVDAFPKAIMKWSADEVFGPTFERLMNDPSSESTTTTRLSKSQQEQKTLVLDTKSCSATENLGKMISIPNKTGTTTSSSTTTEHLPQFSLREHDYVFGEQKFGGNAQSIVKGGWLHHTSFLWDYDPDHMEYLTLPDKRPEYRGDRTHDNFLVSLRPYFTQREFFGSLREACRQQFALEAVTLNQVMEEVIDGKLGGMDAWWKKNRTRIVDGF